MTVHRWFRGLTLGACLTSVVGCGASSAEKFFETQVRLGCRFTKKCQRADWNEAGFDNIRDCVDQVLDADAQDAFVDACDDYDKKQARKCLAGQRRAIRKCDGEAATNEQEEACTMVCGDVGRSADWREPFDDLIGRDPNQTDWRLPQQDPAQLSPESAEPSDDPDDQIEYEDDGDL